MIMPTCKACLGKRQHSVLAHTTSHGDFIGDKEYVYTKQEMRDCSRCNGTGVEPLYGIGLQDKFKWLHSELKEMLNNALLSLKK